MLSQQLMKLSHLVFWNKFDFDGFTFSWSRFKFSPFDFNFTDYFYYFPSDYHNPKCDGQFDYDFSCYNSRRYLTKLLWYCASEWLYFLIAFYTTHTYPLLSISFILGFNLLICLGEFGLYLFSMMNWPVSLKYYQIHGSISTIEVVKNT